jgi:hypothetical protein
MSHTTNVISVGNINVESGSGYFATLDQSFLQPENTISRVERDVDAPVVTNVALGLHVYYLKVLVLETAADDLDARRRAILREFDTTRGPVTVVVENATGTARQRYMQFVVRKVDQVVEQMGRGFLAALEATDEVRWRSTLEEEEVWTVNASGTRSLTVAGDLDVYPVYTLTPNSGRIAPNWPYARRVFIEWRSPLGGRHPVDVTGGGLNTSALLAAEQISDESNIAVMLDGRLVRHFYPDPVTSPGDAFGTTQTRIWVDMEFRPAVYPVLGEYVSDVATTWRVQGDTGLPQSGTLKVEDEIVTYTSRAPGYLYGVSRGRWGTTAAAHNNWSEITHYQGVGWILYGPNAVTPENMKDDDYRVLTQPPMFLTEAASSNAIWNYQHFGGSWQPRRWTFASYLNNLSFVNESNAAGGYDTTLTTSWDALGLKAGWTSLSVYSLRVAVPIKSVRVQGRRMTRISPASAPNAPTLTALSDDQQARRIVWNAGEGASRDTNEWFDVDSGDIRPEPFTEEAVLVGYNRLQWAVSQSSHLQADIQVMWVRLDDDYLPVVTLGTEQTDYDLDLTLANTTTGESITVQFPNLVEGESLVIDSQWQTVTYTLDGSNQYGTVRRDRPRPKFLKLVPGVNNFQITEAGMGELEIKVTYRPRWYA